ncbi:hypothetical protein HCK00_02490 [Streptomyces sp. PLAI1-29]|uniref:Cytochrome b/b6 domain-containing protein n=2 Tax=Streptomyces zingiberis TaxID=2053010 RepID=A0ABX1BVZ5_9ACTN|nr:hypothetical protein [Streptomyces zingiberis]
MSQQKVFAVSVTLLLVVPFVLALATGERFRAFLNFGAGVLSLLTLTGSVVWGLIAAHRVLLNPRDRLLAQGVHRAVAVASIGFLVVHVVVKVSLDHAPVIAALIPFSLGLSGAGGLIGMGSLAAYLMVVAGATGALRSTFVPNREVAGRWRAIHCVAYPAWCFALVHGLYAGRPAAGWVTTMYALCLAAVAVALSVRLLPLPKRRRLAQLVLERVKPGADSLGPGASAASGGRSGADPARDPSVAPLPGAGPRPRRASIPAEPAPPREQLRPPLDSTRAVPIGSGMGVGISAGYRAMSSPDQTGGIPVVEPLAPQPGGPGYPDPTTRPMPAYGSGGPGGGWDPSPGGPLGGTPDPLTAPLPRQPGDPFADPYARDPGRTPDPLTEPFPGVSQLQSSERWPTPSPPPPAAAENIRPTPQPDPLTDTSTGFSYPPPPGEPWQEPAGGRP